MAVICLSPFHARELFPQIFACPLLWDSSIIQLPGLLCSSRTTHHKQQTTHVIHYLIIHLLKWAGHPLYKPMGSVSLHRYSWCIAWHVVGTAKGNLLVWSLSFPQRDSMACLLHWGRKAEAIPILSSSDFSPFPNSSVHLVTGFRKAIQTSYKNNLVSSGL